jgi:hypothetical protein
MTEHPELEALLSPLRSSFHAKRRDVAAQCDEIIRVVENYLKAYDQKILRELAKGHSLAEPTVTANTEVLAVELLAKVKALPELRHLEKGSPTNSTSFKESAVDVPPLNGVQKKEAPRTLRSTPPSAVKSPDTTAVPSTANWPLVRQALAEHPLVIVGGPPHLERLAALAVGANDRIEWVDTTRQGTHAIGNLERRIKDKRISALLILEGLVQHRHSDPLVSTARSAKIPHAYGGKGGRSAIAQALDELEHMLLQRQSISP